MPVRVSSSDDIANQPAPVSPTSTDGWGELDNGLHEGHESEKDGWDDIEPLEEPKPSPSLANIQAAQKRPVSQPKPQVSNLRPKNTAKITKNEDDDLWVDDDDPWAAIAAPAPTTRAKPLSAGRGRGTKPAASKLGAQRINRTSSSGM
ncbi:kinase family with ARM repeat domain-containing protein [Actinidia rufa]|uniref:Kinase family with ARM repeat domain-containing protein n=1 Tax=Actinidia rufa TaxID=165716 RepID=A0A7J0EDE3_9ERIC|nr:kinase family with ARM repeat domain-containing protein [Actinidia rufa]